MNKLQFIKSFDLFSQPFVFFIGDSKKTKQTILGGFLSLLVIAISMIYLGYLLYLYFHSQFLPKFATISYNENNYNSVEINDNLIYFEMIINGEKLSDFEQRKGKKYINYQLRYEQYFQDGTQKYREVPLERCSERSDFPGFICMDFENYKDEQKQIDSYPTKQTQNNYGLIISKCTGQEICAENDEIDDIIQSPNSYFQLYTAIEEYNTTTKQFQRGYKQDYFLLDIKLVLSSNISLIKSKTKIITGMFIQSESLKEHVITYTKSDRYFSNNKKLDTNGSYDYAYLTFELDQNYFDTIIQFPMITEILSQFIGVLEILLTVGILAQLMSQSDIVQDVNSIFLKEYYKLTALQLIHKNKQNIQQDNNHNAKRITELSKDIENTDFIQQQKKLFKVSLYSKLKMVLFGVAYTLQQKYKTYESNIYQRMIGQTVKRADIYEVYRDLIKLKMAIKLMLSKDQYAAIQYCGCSLDMSSRCRNNINLIKAQTQTVITNPNLETNNDEITKQEVVLKTEIEQKESEVIKFDDDDEDILSDVSSKIDSKETKSPQHTLNAQQNGIQTIDFQPKLDQQYAKNTNFNQIRQDIKIPDKKEQLLVDKEIQQKLQQNNQFKSDLDIHNHLNEIDKIEDSVSMREEFLEIFIQRVAQTSEYKLSQIDKNIFHSLIGQDFSFNNNLRRQATTIIQLNQINKQLK